MSLRYDLSSGRYVGQTYSVDSRVFASAVGSLIAEGMTREAALRTLLEESAWNPEVLGVELLPMAARGQQS